MQFFEKENNVNEKENNVNEKENNVNKKKLCKWKIKCEKKIK